MKATFNEIAENLVKVLTDKAESAQYYSDNEQYICVCGWCGTMSPVSRPAYYKTFGKDTTEAAEAKAREIIAEKEAARQRTKYAQHAQEALKKHLSLMQKLRKEVAQAEEQKTAMLNDYMTNHSDKTWQEYLAMVQGTNKKGAKK